MSSLTQLDGLREMDQIPVRIPNDKILSAPRLFFQPLDYGSIYAQVLRVQLLHVLDGNARGQQIAVRVSVENRSMNVPQVETSAVSLNEGIKGGFPYLKQTVKPSFAAKKRHDASTSDTKS
ncbi:MAG TPA: hypothetical protein VFW94_18385 [Candidatus Acidoferrales bacterium]|nr:hypothetical protein [Candidatus Acidoferrales bacterium]